MDLGLAGKTVIVTGGGSNIGRGILLGFIKEGATVINAEISEKAGSKVAAEANALGKGKCIWVKTDVTNWDSVQAMVVQALKPNGRVDVLVNNVGWTYDRLFVEKPRDEWEKEIAINLWSDINCIRAALDPMIKQKYGRVISVASDAGRMGEFREAVYGACKGGVISLTKALARENARFGITFNVVCPGVTLPESDDNISEMSMHAPGGFSYDLKMKGANEKAMLERGAYPLGKAYGRLGRPSDIANMVMYLSSDVAMWITGQTISVNGGYLMA